MSQQSPDNFKQYFIQTLKSPHAPHSSTHQLYGFIQFSVYILFKTLAIFSVCRLIESVALVYLELSYLITDELLGSTLSSTDYLQNTQFFSTSYFNLFLFILLFITIHTSIRLGINFLIWNCFSSSKISFTATLSQFGGYFLSIIS